MVAPANGHHERMRRLFLVALGVTLLSACGIRTVIDVTVDETGAGVVELDILGDGEARGALAAFAGDADPMSQVIPGLAENGWSVSTAEQDGDFEGVTASRSFADLAELESLLKTALGNREFEVSEDDGVVRLRLQVPDEGPVDNDLVGEALDLIDLDGKLTMSFPGRVRASNGVVSDDGRSVTWTYDETSFAGSEFEVEAVLHPSRLPVIVAFVALAAVGAAVVLLRRRRHASPDSMADTTVVP